MLAATLESYAFPCWRSVLAGRSHSFQQVVVRHFGPKVYLTPGSIRVGIDRLLDRGLVSRVESTEDRRVGIVSLTPKGEELIAPIFRKLAAEIRKVFADASPKELRALRTTPIIEMKVVLEK